jgi:hypothetical protein
MIDITSCLVELMNDADIALGAGPVERCSFLHLLFLDIYFDFLNEVF